MSTCAAGYPDHVDADLALAFADRTLTDAERAEVERRIDACAGCRGVIAEAAREVDADATWRERPAPLHGSRVDSIALRPGDVVGRYIVERPLGAGGMGIVNLARDPELRRAVVIKLVRPDAFDDDLEARLRREAQAMAQLSHPNVVQIFDIGRHGDRVFLAIEFIAGQTLDAWLIERERTPAETIAMFLQAGAGLEAAHRAGLLHRDFKPANVLVDRHGVAKVTDFGLARALAAPPERASAATPVAPMTGVHAVLTQHAAVVGTPAYMAPEQARGEPLDARTDQYALALALLDALVGQQPTRRSVTPAQPPAELDAALARAGVTDHARAAIVRALRPEPAERYPDLASFLRDLAPRRAERRRWPAVVAGLALCVAAVTTWIALRPAPQPAACVAEAPRTWRAGPRAAVEARLAANPRVFATWHAQHVLARIDDAADALGAIEVARCEGKPVEVDPACLERRVSALARLATESFEHPHAALRAVERCDPGDVEQLRTLGELRAELASTDASRARTIAERARELADDHLCADALDHAARHALAHGYFQEAVDDYLASAAAGERAGDDSLRGRAWLGLLEVARMRGELSAVREHAKQLGGLLDRHGNAPADVHTVALAAGVAFTETGDVAAAFAELARARDGARTPDEVLRVRTANARATALLRLDGDAARRELAAALDDAGGASPATRAAALALAVELAIERGDAPAARVRIAELAQARPSPTLADQLLAARVRALAGEPAEALAELARIASPEPTDRVRIDVARAQIHAAAGQHAEALAALENVAPSLREPSRPGVPYVRFGLSALERTRAWLARCDAAIATASNRYCWEPPWLATLHPQAPLRAEYLLRDARHDEAQGFGRFTAAPLREAAGILAAAQARPLLVAEVRLRLLRVVDYGDDRKELALAARDVFAAAGRTAEVAELDDLIARLGGGARRDPWGP